MSSISNPKIEENKALLDRLIHNVKGFEKAKLFFPNKKGGNFSLPGQFCIATVEDQNTKEEVNYYIKLDQPKTEIENYMISHLMDRCGVLTFHSEMCFVKDPQNIDQEHHLYFSRSIEKAIQNGQDQNLELLSDINHHPVNIKDLIQRYMWQTCLLCNDFHANNIVYYLQQGQASCIEFDGMIGRIPYFNKGNYNREKLIDHPELLEHLYQGEVLDDPYHELGFMVYKGGPNNQLRSILKELLYIPQQESQIIDISPSSSSGSDVEGTTREIVTTTYLSNPDIVDFVRSSYSQLREAKAEDCLMYFVAQCLQENLNSLQEAKVQIAAFYKQDPMIQKVKEGKILFSTGFLDTLPENTSPAEKITFLQDYQIQMITAFERAIANTLARIHQKYPTLSTASYLNRLNSFNRKENQEKLIKKPLTV